MESAALISKFHYFAANPQVAHAHGYDYSQPIKADGTAMNQSDYEAIANGAYGNRAELGNGPVAGGDGWRYRGG